MYWLHILRICVLALAFICGVVVAGISAHITASALEEIGGYYVFGVVGIAAGGLVTVTVPIMLIIDFVRTGAFTSMVLVELVWLSILSVLLLATGALVAQQTPPSFSTCDFISPEVNQLCNELHSLEAFSFIGWLLLMGYALTLLIVAIVRASRGRPIWRSTVRQSHSQSHSGPAAAAAGRVNAATNPHYDALPQHPSQQALYSPSYPPQHQDPQQHQQPQPPMQQFQHGKQAHASGMPPPPGGPASGFESRPQSFAGQPQAQYMHTQYQHPQQHQNQQQQAYSPNGSLPSPGGASPSGYRFHS